MILRCRQSRSDNVKSPCGRRCWMKRYSKSQAFGGESACGLWTNQQPIPACSTSLLPGPYLGCIDRFLMSLSDHLGLCKAISKRSIFETQELCEAIPSFATNGSKTRMLECSNGGHHHVQNLSCHSNQARRGKTKITHRLFSVHGCRDPDPALGRPSL